MRNMPPGRSARQWLRKRLDTTARAVEVLEQKTHALVRERRRLRHQVEDARKSWHDAMRNADRWWARAAVIGGRRQLDLARSRIGEADARIRWRSLMGVTYPAEVQLLSPEKSGIADAAQSSALVVAADAFERATARALDYAGAARALELVEAELALTRRRLRGLENHWVPLLTRRLHEVELRLAEEEREDMVRAKWVAESREPTS